MSVSLLDLRRQYHAIKAEIDVAIAAVPESGRFILGPSVAALKAEVAAYCGVAHGVGVGSGTDALHLTLQALEIGPGDEVITTPFTFVATAETIVQVGARPVFPDIDPVTLTLDPEAVAARVMARTRAVVVVHRYGQPAAMEPLMALARTHGFHVIEDAAQAIRGAIGERRAGAIGHVSCFSFFPTKNIGAFGDAGMVVTSDTALAERVRTPRQHGSREKYVHERYGGCSRLDALQAAILRVKLRHLDRCTARRRALAHAYRAAFAPLPRTLPASARTSTRSIISSRSGRRIATARASAWRAEGSTPPSLPDAAAPAAHLPSGRSRQLPAQRGGEPAGALAAAAPGDDRGRARRGRARSARHLRLSWRISPGHARHDRQRPDQRSDDRRPWTSEGPRRGAAPGEPSAPTAGDAARRGRRARTPVRAA